MTKPNLKFDVNLYCDSGADMPPDEATELFDQVFEKTYSYAKIFDHIIAPFPIEKDYVYCVHSSSQLQSRPNLAELFFTKLVPLYQAYKNRNASVRISYVSMIGKNRDNIIDKLNGRRVPSISDASVIKCESVRLTLGLFAGQAASSSANPSALIAEKETALVDVMTFSFKNNVRVYFVHCSGDIGQEWDLPWKEVVQEYFLEAERSKATATNFSFVIPPEMISQANKSKLFYMGGKKSAPKLTLEQETDDLEKNLSFIRSDLNLISNFLVNNSIRMAQELDYQKTDDLDEKKLVDMEHELETLQSKLRQLVKEDEISKASSPSDLKKLERFFSKSEEPKNAVDEGVYAEVETEDQLDKVVDKIFLNIRPMNSLEKSRRSRISVNHDGKYLKIEDHVEGDFKFRFDDGIFETKTDEPLFDSRLFEAVTSDAAKKTNYWILGSQGSRSESVLFGSDYSSLIADNGDSQELPKESLLGKIVERIEDDTWLKISYICFAQTHLFDLFEPTNLLSVSHDTPNGVCHNGAVIRIKKSELWKMILYAHGIFDIHMNAQQKSRCTFLLQIKSESGEDINIVKVGIVHAHALLRNITGKTSGGAGGVLKGLLQRASLRCCVCISPSSLGLTETIYWLNLAKVIIKVAKQIPPSGKNTFTSSPDKSQLPVSTPIQLNVQSEDLTNLQAENLQLIQNQHKLTHDYSVLEFRHKHTLETLHTVLKLYNTLSSNITHYACKDVVSIMQRTPGADAVVDLVQLSEIENVINKVGLNIEGGSDWLMPAPKPTTSEGEDNRIDVHDIELPDVMITDESLAKSGMAMKEAEKRELDIDDVRDWVGDLKTTPETNLQQLARAYIDLRLKHADLQRACGDMFEEAGRLESSKSDGGANTFSFKPKSRLQLSRELAEIRKQRDFQSNDIKLLLRKLMEVGLAVKSKQANLTDQKRHLENMESSYSHLQSIYTKMVAEFYKNQQKYQEEVTHLSRLINAITLGGNYYERADEILSEGLEASEVDGKSDDDSS